MKFKFDSDDIPTLNKILKLHNLTIVVRPVFQEDSKYYPGIFFFFCMSYKNDINKSNKSKEYMTCHSSYFSDLNCTYEPEVCNVMDVTIYQ